MLLGRDPNANACRRLLALLAGLAPMGVLVFLALPANALDLGQIPSDHQRPLLTPDEERAWLQALVAASPHRQMLEEAARSVPPPEVAAPEPGMHPWEGAKVAWPKKPGRRVLGYLPYWTQKTAIVPWEGLTQLAWFSAGISGAGDITSVAGWGGPDAKALIQKAHSKGVQVVLTFTQFDTATISKIIATPASRKKAIDNIIATVISGGGDGCNIDFEGLAKADKANMSAFIDELNTAFKQALPGADVTLATPAVDWSGAWAYQFLAEHSDGLMVMAYAIHWGGGNPGPQLPMAAKSPWTHKTLQWVVDDYLLYAKAQNKHKIIVGLPLYGMTWLSASDKPGAAKLEKGKSIFYSAAQTAAKNAGGWKWDSLSESSWFVTPASGGWNQTWCDNLKAFEMRVDYVDFRDTQMGLWALGYSDGDPEVAQAVTAWMAKGAPPPQPDPGPDAGTTAEADADAGSSAEVLVDAGGIAEAKPDSGSAEVPTDAGGPVEPKPDGGVAEVAADTGGTAEPKPDAGTAEPKPDAGAEVLADAGKLDAKADVGLDAAGAEVVGKDGGQAVDGGGQEVDAKAQSPDLTAETAAADTPVASPETTDEIAQETPVDGVGGGGADGGAPAVTAGVAGDDGGGCQAGRSPGGSGAWALGSLAVLGLWTVSTGRRRRAA